MEKSRTKALSRYALWPQRALFGSGIPVPRGLRCHLVTTIFSYSLFQRRSLYHSLGYILQVLILLSMVKPHHQSQDPNSQHSDYCP